MALDPAFDVSDKFEGFEFEYEIPESELIEVGQELMRILKGTRFALPANHLDYLIETWWNNHALKLWIQQKYEEYIESESMSRYVILAGEARAPGPISAECCYGNDGYDFRGHFVKIRTPDIKMAMLYKLTWGGK